MSDNNQLEEVFIDSSCNKELVSTDNDSPIGEVGDTVPQESTLIQASNGVWRDSVTGKIVKAKGNTTKLTSEKVRELKEREALARIQAASSFRSGMARGLGLRSAVAAWGEIGAKQAELAVDTSKGLSSTRAAEFVGKASGFMVKEADNQPSNGGMSIHLGSEAASLLISKLSERFKQGDSGE